MKKTQENTMKTTQESNPNREAITASAAIVATNIDWIKKDIGEIKEALKCLSSEYVTQVEFRPIRQLVYGLVGLILIAVVGALLALVIIR